MKKFRITLLALVAGVALVGASCSDDKESNAETSTTATTEKAADSSSSTTMEGATQSIAEIASSNPDFSTLVSLVGKAGLAETLSKSGTYTVFAPTDEAFAKVDQATLDQLAADPNGALKNVLTLHVLPTEVMAADAAAAVGQCVPTVNGGKLKIEKSGEDLTIGGAKIVKTDIPANNGVIHVIDTVITEPSAGC
jgi:transforming growth factor-beta-induced protein